MTLILTIQIEVEREDARHEFVVEISKNDSRTLSSFISDSSKVSPNDKRLLNVRPSRQASFNACNRRARIFILNLKASALLSFFSFSSIIQRGKQNLQCLLLMISLRMSHFYPTPSSS